MSNELTSEEIEYLISVLKTEQDFSLSNLRKINLQAAFTCKRLTKELIEGEHPICFIIEQHSAKTTRNDVLALLHRAEKLYRVKQDAKKIL